MVAAVIDVAPGKERHPRAPSLRAERSNPSRRYKQAWIASSLRASQ